MTMDKDLFKLGKERTSLVEYSTAEIQEELSKREGNAKKDFIKSVHALYDFGFTYEAVREFLDEV